MASSIYALSVSDPLLAPVAKILAQELGLNYVAFPCPPPDSMRFSLNLTPTHLELQDNGHSPPLRFHIDFSNGRLDYRRRHGGDELLARAAGIKQLRANSGEALLIDATAGLGRDAFVLAARGCRVQMLERNVLLFALLRDGLQRAAQQSNTSAIVSRMALVQAQAATWLLNYGAEIAPDAVYIDPMYPSRQKSAAVKKEMQVLQALVGSDTDSHELLIAALACVKNRVIVKRPRNAAALLGPAPSFSMENATTRFDIYLRRKNL